jgi:hypothetical protein
MTSTRRDSAFLVLAPDFSSTYPTESASRSTLIAPTTTASPVQKLEKLEKVAADSTAVDLTAIADPSDATPKTRRSSSISSTSSARRRFLKLGPVHFGGDPLESDFVEADEH